MPKFTQAGRPIALTTPLGADTLLLEKFSGCEGLSELFRFELEVYAEQAIAFEQLLGSKVSFLVRGASGKERHFHGIVRELRQGPQVVNVMGNTTLTRFRMEVVPGAWLLTRNVQSRVFLATSTPDILREVLKKLDVSFQLTQTYPPRDRCVQYDESDFAFASRLMEEDGIYYFFRHAADGHTMVVTDNPESAPLLEPDTLTYDTLDRGLPDRLRVSAWEKVQQLRSGQVALTDYNFELPDRDLGAKQAISDSAAVGTVSHVLKLGANADLEIHQYPGGYAKLFDGIDRNGAEQPASLQKVFTHNQQIARIRAQQEAMESLRVDAVSNYGSLYPGSKFTLNRHFDGNGVYLVCRVEHTASIEGSYTRGNVDSPLAYENKFQCLPVSVPYRPRRTTPRPRILGAQTATVVGLKGQEMLLDRHGRVKVQFHWDRQGKKDPGSSCWVRVAQFWAGKNWGAFFWPRVGHEVVVIFEDGDPDCPLIVGSVYNEVNRPPVDLPGDAAIAGIRSCIIGTDPLTCCNSLVFYDAVGAEFVVLHSHQAEVNNNTGDKFGLTPGLALGFRGSLPGMD